MTLRLLFALPFVAAPLFGQSADSYEHRYGEVLALAPRADRDGPVSGLTLTRDAGRFHFVSGTLHVLPPVGGRVVGVAFRGRGTFSFTPPTSMERERLVLFLKTPSVEVPFTELVLLFADSTLAELQRKVTFAAPGEASGEVRSLVKKSLELLGDEDSRSLDPDLMAAFLNGDASDLFYAHIVREGGPPLTFMVNPFEFEGVTLATRTRWTRYTRRPEVICRFPRQGATPDSSASERLATATIRDYKMDVTLASTGMAGLSFAAAARIELTAPVPVGPWVPLEMFSKLQVDSARWDDGTPATVFQGKEGWQVWIQLDRRLEPGAVRALRLFYHGDLIERFGEFFFIESSIAWYPRSLEGRSYATFDITYHSPSHYLIASVGERRDSTVAGRVLTTRWVTSAPIRNASFNLGLFEDYRLREDSLPPVIVMVSEAAHRELTQALRKQGYMLPQQTKMKETVGNDVMQSLKFFQHVYGPPPVGQLHATEIPYFHGEAFPGMINLSWATFQLTDQRGEDEVFRAHEVAHQWWGIGVDFATYHDQWLSEGFSDFSGLWYLHAARRDNAKYFGVLRRWRTNIFDKRGDPSPLWLGYRTSSSKDDRSYQVLVYQKGAWVLHMLRIMMLELRTAKDDRFIAMMRDYYATYRGRRASTEDFQRVVERHIGMDMDWFFNQWVYGTAIPSYRVAYKAELVETGQHRVTLRVEQENVPEDFRMYVPVTVDLGENRQGRFRVNVQGPRSEIVLPLLPAPPKSVKFNELDGVLADVKMVGW